MGRSKGGMLRSIWGRCRGISLMRAWRGRSAKRGMQERVPRAYRRRVLVRTLGQKYCSRVATKRRDLQREAAWPAGPREAPPYNPAMAC